MIRKVRADRRPVPTTAYFERAHVAALLAAADVLDDLKMVRSGKPDVLRRVAGLVSLIIQKRSSHPSGDTP